MGWLVTGLEERGRSDMGVGWLGTQRNGMEGGKGRGRRRRRKEEANADATRTPLDTFFFLTD